MTLLNYGSYEEYLDHFIDINDVRYIRNWNVSRQFIQTACGKSCMGPLLSRSEFAEQRKKLEFMWNPRGKGGSVLFGASYKGDDEVLKQFALRELKLINKQIATIVFLIMRSQKGFDISGYIDLEQSLRESSCRNSEHYVNWQAIFEGKAKLVPGPHDLSYFDWYSNKVRFNDSANFRVIPNGAHSLLMMHRGDLKVVCVNAGCNCSDSRNAIRNVYRSSIYGDCMFFDHIIRRIH
ncbi:PREDICTED: uncharacterized protein C4orf22 homolog isoform X1 [Drosophila arizonae]|uniref:Cilia- and flagella-associated protein 299 n=2 Tax=Drosophila arizonae TaxID=7263 RepID=A0ABM1NY95_DROAR|nr:PREDICTED: uncharacterized protein C4orf22 homolog isoform X1 [Drosophila arizonae]